MTARARPHRPREQSEFGLRRGVDVDLLGIKRQRPVRRWMRPMPGPRVFPRQEPRAGPPRRPSAGRRGRPGLKGGPRARRAAGGRCACGHNPTTPRRLRHRRPISSTKPGKICRCRASQAELNTCPHRGCGRQMPAPRRSPGRDRGAATWRDLKLTHLLPAAATVQRLPVCRCGDAGCREGRAGGRLRCLMLGSNHGEVMDISATGAKIARPPPDPRRGRVQTRGRLRGRPGLPLNWTGCVVWLRPNADKKFEMAWSSAT